MRWLAIFLLIAGLCGFVTPAQAEESLGCDQRLALDGYLPVTTPQVIFIGVRGSGESPKLVEGLGRRSVLLYRALKSDPKYSNKIVCTSALLGTYQAQSMPTLDASTKQWTTFINDMMGSANALATPLLKMAKKFPNATFIISGFSKGAAVAQLGVQQAIAQDPSLTQRIDALVLISSPLTPNGIVSLTQKLASTPLRAASIKTAIRLLSFVHKMIPSRCLIPGCTSLKRISQTLDQRQDTVIRTFEAVTLTQHPSMQAIARTIPVFSICKAGDIICAPIADKAAPSLSIHNQWYQYHQEWVQSVRRNALH